MRVHACQLNDTRDFRYGGCLYVVGTLDGKWYATRIAWSSPPFDTHGDLLAAFYRGVIQ